MTMRLFFDAVVFAGFNLAAADVVYTAPSPALATVGAALWAAASLLVGLRVGRYAAERWAAMSETERWGEIRRLS